MQFYHDHQGFANTLNNNTRTGLENIRELVRLQIGDKNKIKMDAITINLWHDPKFFMMSMQENMTENSVILETMINQGIKDGSIQAQDAHSASQVLVLLINDWVFSPIADCREEGIKQRIRYFCHLCNSLGIPIADDEMQEQLCHYFLLISKNIK